MENKCKSKELFYIYTSIVPSIKELYQGKSGSYYSKVKDNKSKVKYIEAYNKVNTKCNKTKVKEKNDEIEVK